MTQILADPRSEPRPAAPASAAGATTVASLERATKRYGATLALDAVDLELRAGEVVALLGPNGAGKTTAIGLLLGLLRPSDGRVRLFGRDPRDAAARVRTGVMMQISGVPETLTVREHVVLQRSYYPSPLPLPTALELAGLDELADRPYGKLSGGQKQRLHLALALCGDPDLLFLDEPTTGLDVRAKRGLWEQIRAVIARGATVVLTTHDLDEADALADRVVLLDHGRVLADDTPTAIKRQAADRRLRAVTRLSDEELRALPGVSHLQRDGDAAELLSTSAEATARALLERDPELRDLTIVDAGLEEAFLALTGRDAPAETDDRTSPKEPRHG